MFVEWINKQMNEQKKKYTKNGTIKKMKTQPTEWEKKITNHISD